MRINKIMAKCIKLTVTKEVVRVSDEMAIKIIKKGLGCYVSKSEYKHYIKRQNGYF